MADKLTSTKSFTFSSDPAPSDPAPAAPVPTDLAAFAERCRLGALTADDEQARINGTLGGTRDAQALSEGVTAATGGHDDVWPVGRPEPPAVASEAVLHPGIDPALVLPRDLARAQAEHEAAKAA